MRKFAEVEVAEQEGGRAAELAEGAVATLGRVATGAAPWATDALVAMVVVEVVGWPVAATDLEAVQEVAMATAICSRRDSVPALQPALPFRIQGSSSSCTLSTRNNWLLGRLESSLRWPPDRTSWAVAAVMAVAAVAVPVVVVAPAVSAAVAAVAGAVVVAAADSVVLAMG